MPIPKALDASRLRATCPPERIPFDNSDAVPRKGLPDAFQPRARQALELGLGIADNGYNIYLAGPPNMGRGYLLAEFLRPRAAKGATPPDVVYLYNFEDADKPRCLELPAGMGRKLKVELGKAVAAIRREVPVRYESEGHQNIRNELMDAFQTTREDLLRSMEKEAAERGFNLDVDETGAMTLYPLVEGKILSEAEFDKLDPNLKATLKKRGDKLMVMMTSMLKKMTDEERGLRDKETELDKAIVTEVLNAILKPVATELSKKARVKGLTAYFQALREDMLDNLDQFFGDGAGAGAGAGGGDLQALLGGGAGSSSGDDFFTRYGVNLFVDNGDTKGAPVVRENHPTVFNLLGSIEREAEMGALITDFTLVKPGALHRANHGFLILQVEDILSHPAAWEGLMRALRAGESRIEDPGESPDQARTKTIEPQPLPLDLKVVLIGTDEAYESLLALDDRFAKLFKVKAHLRETVDRGAPTIRKYLTQTAQIIDAEKLQPFDREALAALVEHASHLAEDQKKLSLKIPLVRDLMLEASAMARMKRRKKVGADILRQAVEAREYRMNLYEEEFMEEYDREVIKVASTGSAIGRVNGLSVTWYGDFEFGLPHQIACSVGVGHGGIIDLEREARLGGPIHTKAMMILKSYLISLFAQDKPLVLTGSLCFEQSYAQIEGDSASGAELTALLSALAQVPVRLNLAFTGAVNQSGDVMAVGGVTRKIEGFFEVCIRRGLTGEQGVIVPVDTLDQLMCNHDVVAAAQKGMFHIYPVRHMDQALELLTGLPAGKRRKDGTFTPGSLYRMVDDRLRKLAELADTAPGAKSGKSGG